MFWIFVSTFPWTYFILFPHISPINADSISFCTCFSLPILSERVSTVYQDAPPTCRPPPLVCASLPCQADQRVPCASMWLTFIVQLPSRCRPWSFHMSLLSPGVLPSIGIFLPLPVFISRTPSPPVSIYRHPSPLPVPIGWRRELLSPVPCASASLSPYSVPSLGVFWSLISLFGCRFVLGWEALAPPLPGDS